MADLNRYSVEVGGIADELLDYLSGENYGNAEWILGSIGLEGLVNMAPEDYPFIHQTKQYRYADEDA